MANPLNVSGLFLSTPMTHLDCNLRLYVLFQVLCNATYPALHSNEVSPKA